MNTQKQEHFFDLGKSGKNIYLSGKAETGKSYIVKELIEHFKKIGRKFIAVAPTGVAANNIGGATIHSTFAVTPYGVADYDSCNIIGSEKRRLLKNVETIIIDEISMLRPDLLDAINWTLRKNGIKNGLLSKQVIFVGDLKQLPPILDDNTRTILYETYQGEQFTHAKIYPNMEVVEIELDEVLRQSNPEFIEALNVIRDGGKSPYFKQFVSEEAKGIIIAPHNSTVARYNALGLEAQAGELLEFKANIEGNAKADDFNLESLLRVKHGCKIMYLANSKNNPLINGTLGEFIVAGNGNYFIKVGQTNYALEKVIFTKNQYVWDSKEDKLKMTEVGRIEQFPFKLAYALSIHKSQGLTFDELTVDLTKPCFQSGQLYVALSRVRTPEGLRLLTNR